MEMTVHRLRRYDRLETLSAYYGVPVCMIMRANAFAKAEDILSCREIKIPKRCYCLRCAEAKKPASEGTYIVQDEDTVFSIAKRFNLTMRIVIKANGLEDESKIAPGDRLYIPDISGERYCVRKGENVEDIAARYQISAQSIKEKNYISPFEKIHAGMQLILA